MKSRQDVNTAVLLLYVLKRELFTAVHNVPDIIFTHFYYWFDFDFSRRIVFERPNNDQTNEPTDGRTHKIYKLTNNPIETHELTDGQTHNIYKLTN